MKHCYTLIAVIAASLLLSANAQSKLDLQSRLQLEEYRLNATGADQPEAMVAELGRLVPKSAFSSFAPGVAPMKMAFVGINDGYTAADLESAGYEVLSNLGKIAIVNVSMNDVETMAELDAVKAIQLGRKMHKCTDKARDDAGVTTVHNGFDYNGTNFQYNGSGVFTAIYDAGVAPNHLNFFDEDGNSRVKRVLFYEEDEENTSMINIYNFNTPEKVALFNTDDEQETHGTHTLGILAGGYKGAATYRTVTPNATYTAFTDSATVRGTNPFYGVATGSEILVGCGSFESTAIAHAATQMAQQAAEEGKPIVFSCSIGSNIGAHDGSDYLSQTLSTLAEDYNLIPVVAAGNEGADKMSVRKTFTSSTDKLVTCATPLSGYSQLYSLLDFWGDSSEPFTLKVTCYTKSLFSGSSTDIFTINSADQGYQYTVSNNSTLKSAFSDASVVGLSEVDKNNDRFHVLMMFNYTRKTLSSNFLYVTVTYQSGRTVTGVINNYGEFTSQSAISGSVAGTSDFSISTMACHPNVISVGSYNSRGMWYQFDGSVKGTNNFQENAVTSFSSYGMTDDGRQLPTLLGPGTNIMSSYSPYYLAYNAENNTGGETSGIMSGMATDSEGNPFYWGKMSGTSMATPFVAGSIALWLEADPTLNINDIKEIITTTSTMDNAISSMPERAGAGRINTQAGIIEILRRSLLSGTVNIEKDTVNPFVTVSGAELSVTAPGMAGMTVDLFNMMGMYVVSYTVVCDVVTCSTSDFTPGVYVLRVTTPACVFTQKVAIP